MLQLADCKTYSHDVKFFGYDVPVTGVTLLAAFVGFELVGSRIPQVAQKIDFIGHFSGIAAGVIAALLIRMEAGKKQMVRVKAPKENTDLEN